MASNESGVGSGYRKSQQSSGNRRSTDHQLPDSLHPSLSNKVSDSAATNEVHVAAEFGKQLLKMFVDNVESHSKPSKDQVQKVYELTLAKAYGTGKSREVEYTQSSRELQYQQQSFDPSFTHSAHKEPFPQSQQSVSATEAPCHIEKDKVQSGKDIQQVLMNYIEQTIRAGSMNARPKSQLGTVDGSMLSVCGDPSSQVSMHQFNSTQHSSGRSHDYDGVANVGKDYVYSSTGHQTLVSMEGMYPPGNNKTSDRGAIVGIDGMYPTGSNLTFDREANVDRDGMYYSGGNKMFDGTAIVGRDDMYSSESSQAVDSAANVSRDAVYPPGGNQTFDRAANVGIDGMYSFRGNQDYERGANVSSDDMLSCGYNQSSNRAFNLSGDALYSSGNSQCYDRTTNVGGGTIYSSQSSQDFDRVSNVHGDVMLSSRVNQGFASGSYIHGNVMHPSRGSQGFERESNNHREVVHSSGGSQGFDRGYNVHGDVMHSSGGSQGFYRGSNVHEDVMHSSGGSQGFDRGYNVHGDVMHSSGGSQGFDREYNVHGDVMQSSGGSQGFNKGSNVHRDVMHSSGGSQGFDGGSIVHEDVMHSSGGSQGFDRGYNVHEDVMHSSGGSQGFNRGSNVHRDVMHSSGGSQGFDRGSIVHGDVMHSSGGSQSFNRGYNVHRDVMHSSGGGQGFDRGSNVHGDVMQSSGGSQGFDRGSNVHRNVMHFSGGSQGFDQTFSVGGAESSLLSQQQDDYLSSMQQYGNDIYSSGSNHFMGYPPQIPTSHKSISPWETVDSQRKKRRYSDLGDDNIIIIRPGTSKWFCKICKLDFSNIQLLKEHVELDVHQLRKRSRPSASHVKSNLGVDNGTSTSRTGNITEDNPIIKRCGDNTWYCEVCVEYCGDWDLLNRHIRSQRHLENRLLDESKQNPMSRGEQQPQVSALLKPKKRKSSKGKKSKGGKVEGDMPSNEGLYKVITDWPEVMKLLRKCGLTGNEQFHSVEELMAAQYRISVERRLNEKIKVCEDGDDLCLVCFCDIPKGSGDDHVKNSSHHLNAARHFEIILKMLNILKKLSNPDSQSEAFRLADSYGEINIDISTKECNLCEIKSSTRITKHLKDAMHSRLVRCANLIMEVSKAIRQKEDKKIWKIIQNHESRLFEASRETSAFCCICQKKVQQPYKAHGLTKTHSYNVYNLEELVIGLHDLKPLLNQ
ncbi:uncharacterized protein LOC102808128 [Saccoglossus kowalevskii]